MTTIQIVSKLSLTLVFLLSVSSIYGQTPTATQWPAIPSADTAPAPAAGETELYCGGFIQYQPSPSNLQIVGALEEQEKFVYSAGDHVYINAGSGQGIYLGQEFSVVRPRGRFTSKFTNKSGQLGVYMQELGRIRVVALSPAIATAIISVSCDTILLGDLLRGVSQKVSPLKKTEAVLEEFSHPSGKQTGRIVLARDGREAVTRSDIVFIDLGTEDNVKPGDFFTVYRPVGRGNVTRYRDSEITPAASGGFESERFAGGKFSIKAPRVRNVNTGAFGPTVKTPRIKSNRLAMPRKVVGELVVLGVQTRTATAVITRVAQEIHTGDYVELQ